MQLYHVENLDSNKIGTSLLTLSMQLKLISFERDTIEIESIVCNAELAITITNL